MKTDCPPLILVGGSSSTDDMVVVRGVNLYPTAVDSVIARFSEIRSTRLFLKNAIPCWK